MSLLFLSWQPRKENDFVRGDVLLRINVLLIPLMFLGETLSHKQIEQLSKKDLSKGLH